MTTNMSPPVSSAGGPASPQLPAMYPPRRRTGMAAAIAALTLAVAALIVNVNAFGQPRPAAQHTIVETQQPATTYSDADIQTAKTTACTAWNHAALAQGAVSRASTDAVQSKGWTNPESQSAIDDEKHNGVSTIAYLRTQIPPATPESVRSLIVDWASSSIDSLHLANMRNWKDKNAEVDRGNELVDKIDAACGMN